MGKVFDQIDQYYLLLVDDAKRFAAVKCIKQKSDGAQAIINDLAHLKTQGRNSKGIQIDCGKESINKKLESWCKERGMEICYTALYSPSVTFCSIPRTLAQFPI